MEKIPHDSFRKISPTATFVAYWRQFTDIPFAKNIAGYINAAETIESFLKNNQIDWNGIRWYAPLFEVRYKSIEGVIRKKKMKQVLELASGLAFRGLAMAQDPDMLYVETDLEELTNEKRLILSRLLQNHQVATHDNFYLASANALDGNQLESALEHFHKGQPVAVVNEGLLPYLTLNEIEVIAKNVRNILVRFGGMWITPDLSLRENFSEVSDQRKRVRDAIRNLTGRQLHRNVFDDEEQLGVFFKNLGLRTEVLQQTDFVSHVVSLNALNLPYDFLAKIKHKLNLWVFTAS